MNDEARWRVISGFRLHRRSWEDGTVVFHEGSGDTHMLGEIETQALAYLEEHSASVAGLVDALSRFGNQAGDDFFHYIERVIVQLERLGIIERA